ncbi:MAG: succinate dehydrogenase, hydrophobic membrane anchor protein [Alphaproteobacteria bacterium]|nr:succinate dehydrogenase, hydrophobic membrane anchor protein [Alphaproteobacteria bacterium]
MSMRTPFSRVTGLGSARDGTSHFFAQRLTAIANIPLTLFLIFLIVTLMGRDQATIATAFSNPILAGLTILTVVSVAWHMKLGMQVVIEDYVHSAGLKLLAVIGNIFFSLLVATIAVVSVLLLGFGG